MSSLYEHVASLMGEGALSVSWKDKESRKAPTRNSANERKKARGVGGGRGGREGESHELVSKKGGPILHNQGGFSQYLLKWLVSRDFLEIHDG